MPLLWSSNTELLAAAHREGIETIRSSMPEIMIDGKHVRLQFFSWVATIRRIWKLIAGIFNCCTAMAAAPARLDTMRPNWHGFH